MKKHKTLCEFNKNELEKYEQLLKEIVQSPEFICKKCYRASVKKELLCKPTKS